MCCINIQFWSKDICVNGMILFSPTFCSYSVVKGSKYIAEMVFMHDKVAQKWTQVPCCTDPFNCQMGLDTYIWSRPSTLITLYINAANDL